MNCRSSRKLRGGGNSRFSLSIWSAVRSGCWLSDARDTRFLRLLFDISPRPSATRVSVVAPIPSLGVRDAVLEFWSTLLYRLSRPLQNY